MKDDDLLMKSITIIIFTILCLCLVPHLHGIAMKDACGNLPRVSFSSCKLRLFIIALSMPDTPRQTTIYNYNYKYINNYTRHRAIFITEPGKNLNNYPIINMHEDLNKLTYVNGSKDRNLDRAAKRISACKYFIENTTFDYLWVGTDDLFFDTDSIEIMLSNFEKQYDTERDVIFKGHIIACGNYYYFQGGSGWLVSRAGAKKIVKVGYDWIVNMADADDMATKYLRIMINLSIEETSTHYMLGHHFTKKVRDGFYKRRIDICPLELENSLIWPNNTLHPLKELVGFHNYPYGNNEAQRVMMNLVDAKTNDPSLYYYGGIFTYTICRDRKYKNSYY